jgi:hypothetical protein
MKNEINNINSKLIFFFLKKKKNELFCESRWVIYIDKIKHANYLLKI